MSSISQYFSTFNITSTYNNNKFTYTWIDETIVNVNFPDGYYSLVDINTYLEYVMITNFHYMISSTGAYIYFLQLQTNQTYYGVQLYSYQLSSTIQAANNWTKPTSATWTMPSVSTVPQFTFPVNDFYKLVGFSQNYTYPLAQTGYTTTQTIISPIAPQITPYTSFLLYCSVVMNNTVIPNNLIFSYTPTNVNFGELQLYQPPVIGFNKIPDGNYRSLEISMSDQNLNSVVFQDPATTIILLIRDSTDL